MKILHVSHRYAPAIGGAEVWLREIASRLADRWGQRIEVQTFALHEEEEYWRHFPPQERVGAYGERQIDGAIEVVRHRASPPGKLLMRAFRSIDKHLGWYLYGPHSWSLYRALPAAIRGADLVHLHTHPYPHILVGLELCRRIGRPVVVTPHFHPAMGVHLCRRSLRALGRADRVFAVTDHERDALVGHGLPAERIVVTGNGVDLEHIRSLARAAPSPHLDLRRTAGRARVAFLGRKVDYKGIDVLIAALRMVRATRPAELVLIGPGSDWFADLLASLPPNEREWIRDLGVLSEADKLAALRSCDLLVQPSPHEAFGIVFLEAWASGLPVVGADSGAVPGVVDGGGLVARPGDAAAFASAIVRLIAEPETARDCAKRGLERVEQRFNWDGIAEVVAGTYRALRPRPQRVLVVSALYPPKSFGGAEVMARTGAVGLAQRGYEVRVFGTYRDSRLPRWQASTHRDEGTLVHYHSVKYEDNFPGFARHHQAVEAEDAFRHLLSQWRPEVVHFHNIQTLSHRLIDIAEDAGIATLMTLHDYWPVCFKHIRVLDDGTECRGNGLSCLGCKTQLVDAPEIGMLDRNAAVRSSFDRLRLLLAPAAYITEHYVEDGIPRERLRLHPYGIELERFRSIAAQRAPRRPLRIAFLGYIGRHKGVFVLAEAALKLHGDFRLLVFGAGDGEPELTRMLRPLGEKLSMRGACPHARIHEAFAEIDVLVLPSLWPDNFPVSILEALASGAPVVASAAGGMLEQVLPEKNGLLVPQGDADALAAALQRLVDDPDLVARLSRGALESSQRYAVGHYLDCLEQYYEESFHGLPARGRTRPLVVHSGLHSDRSSRVLYSALRRLSFHGLEVEPLALAHAADTDIEQAAAVVLTPHAADAAALTLRAFAYGRPVLAPASDHRARKLLECAPSYSLYSDPLDLAARLRVLVEGAAAPPANAAAAANVSRLLEASAAGA